MSRRARIVHRSIDYHRVESIRSMGDFASLEVVLAEEWEKENRPQPGINQGHGILQNLMFTHRDGAWYMNDQYARYKIGQRDASIVATAIQWLGTNVGFCFLQDTLEKAGYRVLYPREVQREDQRRMVEAWHRQNGWRWG